MAVIDRHTKVFGELPFKAHQIFEDVITYTALQFYTREPQDAVRIAAAPDSEMADIDWSDTDLAIRCPAENWRMAIKRSLTTGCHGAFSWAVRRKA